MSIKSSQGTPPKQLTWMPRRIADFSLEHGLGRVGMYPSCKKLAGLPSDPTICLWTPLCGECLTLSHLETFCLGYISLSSVYGYSKVNNIYP